MKVIFANRSDCLTHRGGDTVQMLKTKEYLESNFGVSIVLVLNASELYNFKNYDLVHIFNIQTASQTIDFIKAAKELNIPIILSPIYWNLWHSFVISKTYDFISWPFYKYFSHFESLGRLLWKFIPKKDTSYLGVRYKSQGDFILSNVDYILPNSYEEIDNLCRDFGLSETNCAALKNKSVAVPNAIENKKQPQYLNDNFAKIYKLPKDYVLVVGRIEPNKNQLSVLLALLNEKDIPIVFVGRKSSNSIDLKYGTKLEEIAATRGNVYFIPEVKHEDMYEIYKSAAVHVLASFRESPGLVTLEALKAGSKIVFSSRSFCPVDFYGLKNYGSECNPYDVASIKSAILYEINLKRDVDNNEFFERFSYDIVAKKTFDVYRMFVKKNM